jgi:hypothetical protein
VALGHWRYGGLWPLAGGKVSVFRLVCFRCLFRDGEGAVLPEVGIRLFPFYPRFDGASSAGPARDSAVFRVRLCGFRPISSDLWLSILAMVAVVVRLSFGTLARQLHVYLLQQALL